MRVAGPADIFPAREKQRVSQPDVTLVVECALVEFMKLRPRVRDRVYHVARERKRISSTGRGVDSARTAAVPEQRGSAGKSRTKVRPSNLEY
jgi:hypothetical protein